MKSLKAISLFICIALWVCFIMALHFQNKECVKERAKSDSLIIVIKNIQRK